MNKKLYTFNEQTLEFVQTTTKYIELNRAILYKIIIALIIGYTTYIWSIKEMNDQYMNQETEIMVITKYNQFTDDKFKTMLVDMNFKFPDIVYAQAILETGTFTSRIFKENNNLFGMKVSRLRPTTHKGEQNGHAYYDDWKDSVLDYALYQARYLNGLKTREEYLSYLNRVYAEDTLYVSKLKNIMEKNKNLF